MALIEKIQSLVTASCPGYGFEYETRKMMNEKADNLRYPLVFFQEYTNARYTGKYNRKKTVQVQLSFQRLAPFQCDAIERERIRERIEAEAVLPFVEALDKSPYFDSVQDIDCPPEPPLYDANAVGILLSFWVTFNVCSL